MLIYGDYMVNDNNDNNILVGGWPTPLKNMMDFVSWDYDIPNSMEKIKQMFQTTNQEIDGFQIVEHILSPNRMNIGVQPVSVAWWRMVHGGS